MEISNLAQKIKVSVLDTLFPIACLSCGCGNSWLCEKCFSKIEILSFQVCPRCEKTVSEKGAVCRNCRPFSDLDALLVASKYKESNIAKLVHNYKYRFIKGLHVPLGALMVKALTCSRLAIPDIIIPVPLHPRRLRWRGFNQSALIARCVGKNLIPNMEITIEEGVLLRKRYARPQMKIRKYSDRLENMRDIFEIAPGADKVLAGKTVLLVDDIATTGATLFGCASALKKGGARKIFSVVIARQEI